MSLCQYPEWFLRMFQYSAWIILPLIQFEMVVAWIVSVAVLVTVINMQPKNKNIQACKKTTIVLPHIPLLSLTHLLS